MDGPFELKFGCLYRYEEQKVCQKMQPMIDKCNRLIYILLLSSGKKNPTQNTLRIWRLPQHVVGFWWVLTDQVLSQNL